MSLVHNWFIEQLNLLLHKFSNKNSLNGQLNTIIKIIRSSIEAKTGLPHIELKKN